MISGTIHARPLVVVVERTCIAQRDAILSVIATGCIRGEYERERESERERVERKEREKGRNSERKRKGEFDRAAIYDREKFVEIQLARKAERDTENRVAVT